MATLYVVAYLRTEKMPGRKANFEDGEVGKCELINNHIVSRLNAR